MQFVKNGPDVPERLLQAHEEGRVVFFCGAGISNPAGLPGFSGLVKKLYGNLSVTPDAEQQIAIKTKRFDTAIGLLENSFVGGREAVRTELANILTPNLAAPGATSTHGALLALSRNREERTRLVTTNFDRLFEEAIGETNLDFERFQAPLLPVPKSRWHGLVYLHGMLSAEPSAHELDRLVVSSGDFGLAYLIERWAARFVGELFRNYTVCFVGYSLDDPVLRYMTDALTADRLLGELPLEMFAFGSHSDGRRNEQTDRWKAKNVTPILYREYRRHQYLHRTLREWAETYRDGIRGKEHIIAQHATSRPLASTSQDDFVDRVLWALSDPSGLPAKRFTNHEPVPALDWLEPLGDERYGRADLSRFGVTPHAGKDGEPKFSLICRPSPYTRTPWMTLVGEGTAGSRWDAVMSYLAHWLLWHLDDPKLVLWLAKRGGRLRREFVECVEWRLEELDKLESDGNTDELRRIRGNAPHAVPRPAMRTLWRLMLAGRMESPSPTSNIYQWLRRFGRDGLTAALRLELRALLTPRISLREPFHWNEDREDPGESERIEELVDWDIALSADHVYSALRDLREIPHWPEALPVLLDDFGMLLRDTMDLMRELGGADDKSDRSYVYRPSIEEHPQNRNFHDWTALIELTRDAWRATAEVAPERARLTVESWHFVKYPVFQRLAFFAATHDDIVPLRQALGWLLTDDRWWLWSMGTRRESMRLLATLAPKLDGGLLAELEQAVLTGPPRAMYKDDLEDERWMQIIEREVWLLLAKINEATTALGADAKAKFEELTSSHPDWLLQEGDRDEFPVWVGDGSELSRFMTTPRRRRELVDWIRQHPETPRWPNKDDWARRCHEDFPTTACALRALARDGDWPVDRWREALQTWSEEKLRKRSWRYTAPVLADAPGDALQALSHNVSRWLVNIAKTFDYHEDLFLDFCRRLLTLDDGEDTDEDSDDLMNRAINHPVGHVTEALLNWWYRDSPEDEQGLPEYLKILFSELCDIRIEKFRHGRILLAAHIVSLFRVDREWTERHLLPLFDWCRGVEASVAWEGFLWSARLYRPLMESIKKSFLDAAQHYERLGPCREHYPALLTFAALDRGDTFTTKELRAATEALPEEGLRHVADTLARALDSSGDRRAEYWRNRTLPYWRSIWPKSLDRKTPTISNSLGEVCVAAGDEFPDALNKLRHWLQIPQYPDYQVHRLKEAGLCDKFPEDALAFLKLVVGDERPWGSDLKECLERIRAVEPGLSDDPYFRTLRERLCQFGQELE